MFSGMPSLLNIDHINRTTMSTSWSVFGLNEVVQNGQLYHHPSQNYPRPTLQIPIIGQRIRIQVYIDNAWAVPLPDAAGHFRYCNAAFYRDNPTQMHRLHTFILRDVVAIRESVRLEGPPMPFPENADMIVTSLIMPSLFAYDIRQLHVFENLRPFLNTCAAHFCHELYNFANSPYEISDYDQNVQYTNRPNDSESTASFYQEQSPPIHTVGEITVLDSNNEELQSPNVIEDGSSTDDTDVEILSHSLRFNDPLNLVPIDQPYTSTGIRDLLDVPNTSFQSVYGGLSRVSYSSRVKRGRSNLDSSSDDDESIIISSDDDSSIIDTQCSQTAHLKPRDLNNKKKRKHQ